MLVSSRLIHAYMCFLFFFFPQVGLLGMARSLQQDLNRIAERADTSTPEGLSYVLTGKFSLCNCVNVDPFIDVVGI